MAILRHRRRQRPGPPHPTTITPYVAIDPTQPVTFFIGAGDNQNAQTSRTQDGGAGPRCILSRG